MRRIVPFLLALLTLMLCASTGSAYSSAGLANLARWTDRNSVVARFVYALDRNVPEYMIKDGRRYRLLTDPIGSVRMVVRMDGAPGPNAIVQRTDYDEWGKVVSEEVAAGFEPVPFGFAGGLYDRDTKLVRFGARDYDAEIGRWINRDPLLFGGGDTNLYAYVGNDPVNGFDPNGQWAVPVAGIIVTAILAALTVDSSDDTAGTLGIGVALTGEFASAKLLSMLGWGSKAARGGMVVASPTGGGSADAVLQLTRRQRELLAALPETGSVTMVPKRLARMGDVLALAERTGQEFAVFTRGGTRLVVRGAENQIPLITGRAARILGRNGWRWSAHVHPSGSLMPSFGDQIVLGSTGGARSMIMTPGGGYSIFSGF